MENLKFSSFDEAKEYLENITNKKIKIAWEDESKKLLKDVAKELKSNPSILLKLNKEIKLDLKELVDLENRKFKFLPTNKGDIKVVQDIEENAMNKIVDKITQTNSADIKEKILDFVIENKKDFPEFYKKYKKGIQKDESGPYYRPKTGLIQKGIEKIKKEDKGEMSKEEIEEKEKIKKLKEKAKEKIRKEAEETLDSFKEVALDSIDREIKEDSSTKKFFEQLINKPHNKAIQKQFFKEFEEEIKDKNINKETAKSYLKIIKKFSNRVKNELSDFGLDKFIDKVEKIADEIEDITKEAPEKTKEEEKIESQEKKNIINLKSQRSSDFSQEIKNVIKSWSQTYKSDS